MKNLTIINKLREKSKCLGPAFSFPFCPKIGNSSCFWLPAYSFSVNVKIETKNKSLQNLKMEEAHWKPKIIQLPATLQPWQMVLFKPREVREGIFPSYNGKG